MGFLDSSAPRQVYHLKKAFYRLKQSPQGMEPEVDNFLQAYDLLVSSTDICVYVNKLDPKLIIVIWVDDGICCNVLNDVIMGIFNYMEGAFPITKGLAEIFVGLYITRDRD